MRNTCQIGTANTAPSKCQKEMGKVMVAIVTPLNAEFTGLDSSQQPQTFDDWLEQGIHAANPTNRFYPMPTFVGLDDNSSDNVTDTTPYGDETVISEGKINITQQYSPDYCLTNRLHAFNDNSPRRVIFIDSNSNAWGTERGGVFKGYKMRIFASSKRPNTADAITNPNISYSSLSSDEWARKGYRELEVDYDSIIGLENIELVATDDGTNTNFIFVSECSNDDVTSEMQAMNSTAWLKNGTPMNNAPTYNNGVFTIDTLEVTDSKISIADPSVLYSQGVVGKEVINSVEL